MIRNLSILLSVCQGYKLQDPQINSEDPTTFSNYHQVYSQHLSLDLSVDFDRKNINGVATHRVYCNQSTDTITMDFLGIVFNNVTTLSNEGSFWEPLTHTLYVPEDPNPTTSNSSAIQMTLKEPC